MVFLTGRLEIVVVEARGLPNLDENILSKSDKSDPYCTVSAEGINGSRRIGKTPTINDSLNPKWNFKMVTEINQDVSGLQFVVKDKDMFRSEVMGSCIIEAMSFVNSHRTYSALQHLTGPKGKPAGAVRVQIKFTGGGSSTISEASVSEKMRVKTEDLKGRLNYSTKHVSKDNTKSVVLHGMLEIYVDKAVNLPNMDKTIFSFKKTDVSDPFIDILVEDALDEKWKVATTSVIDNNLNPVWKETFYIHVCHDVVSVKFVVKDKDVVSADIIGTVTLRAEDLVLTNEISGDFDIYISEKAKNVPRLTLCLRYKSSKELSVSPEVPGCVFKMRECNKVTLYQDAHCVGLPPIKNKHGQIYKQSRAWGDLYNAIMGAKEYIYIVGWSVNTKISLLRWNKEDDRCIGEILLQKANEGVQVILLLWDELTSTEFNKEGAMGTSDEATADFFKNTPVTVILASRERKSKDISTKQRFTNFCYTHHQKSVLVDSEVKGFPNKRETTAFMGGLDLTNGRFDTPDHPLFDTLGTDHRDDFYNSVCITKPMYGPREPWHDIHCRIEGPVTQDLLSNFRERWNRQGSKQVTSLNFNASAGSMKHVFRSPERWNVQVFRSINSDSALFQSPNKGLAINKERIFDDSIQRAYIHHIRRSKKFLYMENQYFMGSSHEWLECRDTHIENLIPLEIAAHIEDKIKHGERYVAYILVPMFPEGKPADKVIQEILHWQFRTMEMMYSKIANAIKTAGLDAHPQDYLLFFCLGKKEKGNLNHVPSDITGHAAGAFKHRRLMIYVHSKMVIFDDEYIIIGSANINDRSMNGNRDTEIAMGTFQAEHQVRGTELPDGEVSMFRKSLWLEHMGSKTPLTEDPSDLKCARVVRGLAEEGLVSFLDQRDLDGIRHLLIYPLDVAVDGKVTQRFDCPSFPDTPSSISGKRSGYIPTNLTS